MTNRLRGYLLTALLLAAPPSGAIEGSDMLDMMTMMAGMMSLWNTFSSLSGGVNGLGGDRYGLGDWNGNRYGYNNLPASPWESQRSQQGPWGRPAAPRNSELDGLWRSQEGVVMEIRGQRFRLHLKSLKPLEGSFLYSGRRFIAYIANTDTVLPFLFERRGNAFILQDADGHMYLFQRVRQQRW